MKNLVIGPHGLLGSEFVWELDFEGEEVFTAGRKDADYYFDLTDPQTIDAVFEDQKFERVFFCAYKSHVDWSELNPIPAHNVNLFGNWYAIRSASRSGAKVFFPSSSYVFDGKKKVPYLYEETDKIKPLNVYGRDKRELENTILEECPKSIVFRTVGVFGEEIYHKNFVYQVLQHIQMQKEMRVPDDQFMNPIWSSNLAKAVLDLDETGYNGLIHIAGNVSMSKYRWARSIAELTHDEELIIPVKSAELDQVAERPKNAVLSCQRFLDLVGYLPEMGMREFLNGLHPRG